MNAFANLSPILIPVIAMLVPIVWIISWTILKITRLRLLHETVRQLSERGQPIPPEFIGKIVDGQSS
jgi:hypothetical protein